jgi:NhaP-type Na+/H+ or K+/H+ antiporter
MHAGLVIGFVGALIFLAHLFAAVSSRTRIVDGVFLLSIGLLLGPVFHLVEPSDFGKVGPVFTAVALVMILFEGGLELRLDTLRKSLPGTVMLCLTSFVSSLVVVALGAHYVGQLDLLPSLTMGAMVGGTSPVVIIPLVRQLQLRRDASALLSLEAAVSDVFAIVVSLGLLEAQTLGRLRVGHLVTNMLLAFFVAIAFGAISGMIWSGALKKIRTLKNAIFTTPALLFIIYGFLESMGYAGAIAALAFGIVLGNAASLRIPLIRRALPLSPVSLNHTEKILFSEVGFLLKTFFFVYIGLSINLYDNWLLFVSLVLVGMLMLVRPLVARISISRNTTPRDASIVAVMVPRGLAAAALASLPLNYGLPDGQFMQNIAYGVILFSILLSSMFAFMVDRTPAGYLYRWMFTGFGSARAVEEAAEEDGVPEAALSESSDEAPEYWT